MVCIRVCKGVLQNKPFIWPDDLMLLAAKNKKPKQAYSY